MAKEEPSIGHVCPNCINAVFWAHREALERVLDISNTPGENEDVKRRGMADTAFDCLSFFDLYYDGCLHYKTGTLKDHEVWIAEKADSKDSSNCGGCKGSAHHCYGSPCKCKECN